MLPFLKKTKEASASFPPDVIERKPDDPADTFGMLDAVVDDLMEAIHSKNKKLLKSSLEALCEHIQDKDEQQDEEMNHDQ